jgi:hypothetical protein
MNKASGRHYLKIVLREKTGSANLFAVGVKVVVVAGETVMTRYAAAASGKGGGWPYPLHFGLGTETKARVNIRWPDGTLQAVTDVAADQTLVIQRE